MAVRALSQPQLPDLDFEAMTAEELRKSIDLSPFNERFAHGDRFIQANFDAQMKVRAVERMWEELSGQWKPEGS